MAANSKSERLVQNVVTTLEELGGGNLFKKVERIKLGFEDLMSSKIPTTLLPYAAVTCGLPDATPKISGRTRAIVDKFQSVLTIELTVYGMDNENPDVTILSVADDMWAGLYNDPGRGGLALATRIIPEVETGIFDPYYAFNMDVEVVFVHSRSSI